MSATEAWFRRAAALKNLQYVCQQQAGGKYIKPEDIERRQRAEAVYAKANKAYEDARKKEYV